MLLSLGIYLRGSRALPRDQTRWREGAKQAQDHSTKAALAPSERRNAAAIIAICATVTLFWAAYDQQGNTILLWVEDFTDRSIDIGIWRGELPSPWFLALNPLFIFVLTPVLVRFWAWQGEREPSPLRKMAFGALCLTLANLVMATAAWSTPGKASALWVAGYFVLATIGELHVAPVGLSLISKLAPARVLSMLMGTWFAATLPADIFGGFIGGFWSSMSKAHFFLMVALIAAVGSAALWIQESAIQGSEVSNQ
jgi:proton-dependent oligopeptide transporter, POT family